MSKQARSGTQPELELRRALHRDGYRFRVGWPVPGMRRRTIDVALTRRKIAVFVDGCFWHGCPDHSTLPQANSTWWQEKLAGNVARDVETSRHLEGLGWAVVRVWEHESTEVALARVAGAYADAACRAHVERTFDTVSRAKRRRPPGTAVEEVARGGTAEAR